MRSNLLNREAPLEGKALIRVAKENKEESLFHQTLTAKKEPSSTLAKPSSNFSSQ